MSRLTTAETEKEIASLKETLDQLRHQLKKLASPDDGLGTKRFHEIGARLKDIAQERYNQLLEKLHQARDYSQQSAEQARQKIRTKPLSTAAAVFGIGALVGYLLHRSRG